MTLINLICPHCGGEFELDPDRSLQSFWTCPYCGNKSLMQMSDGKIRLRGIISSRPDKSKTDGKQDLSDAALEPALESAPSDTLLTAPAKQQPLTAPADTFDSPDVQEDRSDSKRIEDLIKAATPVVTDLDADEDLPATVEEPPVEQQLAGQANETPRDELNEDIQSRDSISIAEHAALVDDQAVVNPPVPDESLEVDKAYTTEPPDNVQDLHEPATEDETPSAVIDSNEEIGDQPVASVETTTALPDNETAENIQVPDNKSDAVETPLEQPITADSQSRLDQLCHLAQMAANDMDYPLFNTYSRQALDIAPKEPRIYALRAKLIEEANGFSRHTWAMPGWSLLTPKQQAVLVAQHLYHYSTAMASGSPALGEKLTAVVASHMVRQAYDLFTELAELRCQKRLLFKSFKGRYKNADLNGAKLFTKAMRLIDAKTCPDGFAELLDAVRMEINRMPHAIKKRLSKV